MKRTTKAERKQNARNFYQVYKGYVENRACIVVQRNENDRVQFLTTIGSCNRNPMVIAETVNLGITGCWKEFIQNIAGNIDQVGYFEPDFDKWLIKTMGFDITYYDGLVFIIERV